MAIVDTAIILAAGRGERLRPLTDRTPKPLLPVGGKPLIVHHLEALADAGFRRVVINLGHLGGQIPAALGDGRRWGLQLHYSPEPPGALETGGGIHHALALLASPVFAVVNGDVWTDLPRAQLIDAPSALAHLILVPNPAHNPVGDFTLEDGVAGYLGQPRYTYSGMAVLHRDLFATCAPGRFPLAPLLRSAMDVSQATGVLWAGRWCDVGTVERLHQLEVALGATTTPPA